MRSLAASGKSLQSYSNGDFLGTALLSIICDGMDPPPTYRALAQLCRTQAALTSNEATKRELETMAEEYRAKAERADERAPPTELVAHGLEQQRTGYERTKLMLRGRGR